MAPITMADPAMHTIYIVDPQQMYVRYAGAIPIGRMREGARVGFLVPARLAYLAFGAVPGFFVTRYVFALIAVVPVYLLLRRLYGRWAGVAGILIVLSSPVIVTAWGTDYANAAVVSYAAGGLACLAMPCSARWRRAWLAAAGTLFTLAVWSHGVAVPLVAATMVGYLAVRLVRERAQLVGDLALLVVVASAATGVLVAASAVLFGYPDFIGLTLQGVHMLSQSAQVATWHAATWGWAPHLAYLLVPPAVLGCFIAVFARRGRSIPTPVLVVATAAAAQLVAFACLEFFWTLQDLEQYFFSSVLWAGVCLVLAITVAELARPLSGRVTRWLPAAVLLAVPLCYEADPHVPTFEWLPIGLVLAVAMIAAAAAARASSRLRARPLLAATTGLMLAVMAGAGLVLTVSPQTGLPLPNTPVDDVAAPYAGALGGGFATYVDAYQIATELPAFVGQPAYTGEQLMIWYPHPKGHTPWPYVEDAGIFHENYNSFSGQPPKLTRFDWQRLHDRRPAEVLLYANSARTFPAELATLAPLAPKLVRTGELRAGSMVLHVWLIRLDRYYHRATAR
jgi:Dolichyl-phosphate-mannose-protein mannosyltransferase